MKRILAVSLSAALLLALLGACSGGADSENTVIPSDTAGDVASVPPTDTTQEPSLALPGDEPTEEVSEEPSAEPTQRPSQSPATQTPAPTHHPEESHHVEPTHHPEATHHPEETHHPDPPPTVPGGGIIFPGGGGAAEPSDAPSEGPNGFSEPTGPSASDVNLEDFLWTVAEKYDFPGLDVLPTGYIAELFPGLASIPAVQRVVGLKSTTPSTAEIDLIQVTNLSDLSKVEKILENRVQYVLSTQGNYPDVVRLWTNNYQIVNRGNYIMLVVDENYEAIVSDFIAALS